MTDDTAKDAQAPADDAVARAKAGQAIAPDDGPSPDGPNLDNPYAHIAETEFKGRTTARRDLVDRIVNDPRMHDHKEGFESCIRCGICKQVCPEDAVGVA